MEKHFHLHASKRKPLIEAIENVTGQKHIYAGAPTFSYIIGDLTLDNKGTLVSDNAAELERVSHRLVFEGFRADEEKQGLTISFSLEDMDEGALERLKELICAKHTILIKALGADATDIEVSNEAISFPWFSTVPSAEVISAATDFLSLLLQHAKKTKRVTGKEREVENEKYYFRCFLLRIGMIGEQYRKTRRTLLKNLTGSSAFRFLPKDKEAQHAQSTSYAYEN